MGFVVEGCVIALVFTAGRMIMIEVNLHIIIYIILRMVLYILYSLMSVC